MPIIGFNFNKITAEKKSPATGQINVKNNIAIKKVEKLELQLGAKQPALAIYFEYTTTYEPKIGMLKLEGMITHIDNEAAIENVVREWKKNRQLPENLMNTVMNHILQKSNIEAVLISREINLPPPIKVAPRLQVKK